MQLEVGSILEGRVTGITKFGAFIELPGGKTGMVHISEVASSYVKEITDYLSMNQMVKQAAPASPTQDRQPAPRALRGQGGDRPARPFQRRAPREVSYGFDRRQPITNENMSFEDMMSKFKQASDDKMSDLKRYTDMKRGSARNRPR